MAVIVVPDIFNLGRSEAESFHSLIHRTAAVYQVPVRRMLELLNRFAGGPASSGKFTGPSSFVGYSLIPTRTSIALAELAERCEIGDTTLTRLRHVLDPQMRSVFSLRYRWCPDCVHPESGVGYGTLASLLAHVRRCPIHGSPLNDRCLSCGCHLSATLNGPEDTKCRKCGDALWTQRRLALDLTPYEVWCEAQIYQLIEYATDPNEDEPDGNWSAKLGDGLVKLRDADHLLYSRSERKFVAEMVERAVAYRGYRPSLDSLLRVASIQAVGVVDLIRSPVESCSPRLFDVGRAKIGSHQRKTVHAGRWAELKDVVERALPSPEKEWLPTKQALFRPYGLSPSGFWQHFPALSAQYERERALRVSAKWMSDNQRAIATARRLVEKRLRRGQKVHVRTSGAVLMRALGISKATAESAMNVALGRRARPGARVSVSGGC